MYILFRLDLSVLYNGVVYCCCAHALCIVVVRMRCVLLLCACVVYCRCAHALCIVVVRMRCVLLLCACSDCIYCHVLVQL